MSTTDRDVPLYEGVFTSESGYRYLDDERREQVVQLVSAGAEDTLPAQVVRALLDEGDQVIVFVAARRQAVDFATTLAQELGQSAASEAIGTLGGRAHGRLVEELLRCLKGGVAFHISDLGDNARRVIERTFRSKDSEIRVIVATTTLSQGVNLAADSVVIRDLRHPGSPGRSYTVAEYKNMAGRAGRTGVTPRGRAIVIAHGRLDADQKWRDFVTAAPDPVRSALDVHDLRSAILFAFTAPAANLDAMSAEHIDTFLSWTFAAQLHRVGRSLRSFSPSRTGSALAELVAGGLVESIDDAFALTGLGRIATRSGLGVDSVIVVAKALRAVDPGQLTRMTLITAAQLTEELQDDHFSLPAGRWRKEWQSLQQKLRQQNIAEQLLEQLMGDYERQSPGAMRAKRSLACLRWSRGTSLPMIERELLEHQYVEVPNAGPVEQAARRAGDIIDAVIDIAMVVHRGADLGDLPELLPAQLELGIPADLLPVVRHLTVDLDRETWLDLARDGFGTAKTILDAPEASLLAHVGTAEALTALREAATKAEDQPDTTAADDYPPPTD